MNQNEFDFTALEANRSAFEHAEKLVASAAAEFGEQRLCIAWVTQSDGQGDAADWWATLSNIRQREFLSLYRCERASANLARSPMRPVAEALDRVNRHMKECEEIATRWAQEIRECAAAGKPMPYAPPSQGSDHTYRIIVMRAFTIAGVVIVAPPPEPNKPRRRDP